MRIFNNKIYSIALSLSFSSPLLASPFGVGFYAPTYNGKQYATNPETGAIIYDTSDDTFYGYDDASPAGWIPMSKPSVYWRVDANIQSTNSTNSALPTSGSITDFKEITNSNLSLTNNSGTSMVTAAIPCSTGNAPGTSVCSSGDESIGVTFTAPRSGDVQACVSFSHNLSIGATAVAFTNFQIIRTVSNIGSAQCSSTIPDSNCLEEGKSRLTSSASGPANLAVQHPLRVCGTFTVTSGATTTLRLMFEQTTGGSGSLTGSDVLLDAGSTVGQRDVHWEVYPLGI